MIEGYDIAQVCMNGHVANSSTLNMPENSQRFCEKCGFETITNCTGCNKPIMGMYWGGGMVSMKYMTPKFCANCGKPFPWTLSRINAAHELAKELDELDDNEKANLQKSINELVNDSPATPVAIVRFKKLIAKAGQGVASMFRDILVDVISESAKKSLWP